MIVCAFVFVFLFVCEYVFLCLFVCALVLVGVCEYVCYLSILLSIRVKFITSSILHIYHLLHILSK